GWMLKVNSAIPDATQQIVAIPGNSPPPPGAQYFMPNVTLTYTGGGSGSLFYFADGLYAIGVHNFEYDRFCSENLPPFDLAYAMGDELASLYSGQSISGNICYEIATNDAASLKLVMGHSSSSAVWFALR